MTDRERTDADQATEDWLRETDAWLRRYNRSPRRIVNVVRHWGRYVFGLHCLVAAPTEDGWKVTRCRTCGYRWFWKIDVDHACLHHRFERGCPLVDRIAEIVARQSQ